MKLTIYLMLFMTISVSASVKSQSRISFKKSEMTYSKLFENINNQTGLIVLYNNTHLDKNKSVIINAKEIELEEVLKKVLNETGLTYEIFKEYIVLKPKSKNPKSQSPQEKIIKLKGKVTDVKGIALPGVSVQIKGTHNGISTDANGEFKINVTKIENIQLIFSFVGMKKKVVKWNNQKNLIVKLEEDVNNLDAVVCTGYQTLSKRESASSVVRVKAEDVMVANKLSVDQMLVGKVSGMNVLQTSGEPGSAPVIRIRGTSSIIGNKAPLWVVDGIILDDPVPVDNSALNSDDAAYLVGTAIAGINPQDIDDITVLKDASATAIYGVRAANGVIVVSTKKGRKGDMQVTYNGSVSVNVRPSYGDFYLMNAKERIQLSQDIIANGLEYSMEPENLGYEGLLKKYWDKQLSYEQFVDEVNYLSNNNTDWYDILFRNSITNSHSVSVSGGTDRTNYYASVGYNDNQGTGKGSSSERITSMVKINSWLNDKIHVGFKINASKTDNKGYFGGVNPNQYAYETSRSIPAYYKDGSRTYYYTGSEYSPISFNIEDEMEETGKIGVVQDVLAQLNLDYSIIPGLKYRFTGSYAISNTEQQSFATQYSNYVSTIRGYDFGTVQPNSEAELESKLPYGGIKSYSNTRSEKWTLRNSLLYNKCFNHDHVVNLMAGSELRSTDYNGNNGEYWGWEPERGNVFNPIYTEKYIEQLMTRSPVYITDNTTNFVSWFGTAAYTYKNKLTFNANIRADGSNKFGTNPKYRFLPVWSMATKYIVSEEEFVKNLNIFDYLAFRYSYGVQGNVDNNSSPDLVVKVNERDPLTKLNSSSFKYLPNPDLRWEKTTTSNIGLDYSFLDARITGTLEYYHKKGEDMIIQKAISQSLGRDYVKINAGDIENYGYEGSIQVTAIKTKDFEWITDFNIAYNANKLLKANEEEATIDDMLSGSALQTGKPVGSFYSYDFAGLNPDNGYPMFWGKDGKKYYELKDENVKLVYSGNRLADVTGGFGTHFKYKNLRLDLSFNYSIGGKKRLPSIYKDEYYNIFKPSVNVTKELNNRWKKPGDENHTIFPVLYDNDTYDALTSDGTISTDVRRGLEMYDRCDARVAATDNLRLRTLTLSYLLPNEICEKFSIKNCRFSFQAQNLFLLAKDEWHGKDPESGNSNMPIPKVYSFSLNVGF